MIVYSVELKNKKIDWEYCFKLFIMELKSLLKVIFNVFVWFYLFYVMYKFKYVND